MSLALAGGATMDDVKRMVGHSTIAMTSDTYGHLVEGRSREVADRIADRIARWGPMAEDSLDDAWAEVEQALPDGWQISALTRNSARGQTKAQAWWAVAHGLPAMPGARSDKRHPWPPGHRVMAYGPTPAGALRALAERLRKKAASL